MCPTAATTCSYQDAGTYIKRASQGHPNNQVLSLVHNRQQSVAHRANLASSTMQDWGMLPTMCIPTQMGTLPPTQRPDPQGVHHVPSAGHTGPGRPASKAQSQAMVMHAEQDAHMLSGGVVYTHTLSTQPMFCTFNSTLPTPPATCTVYTIQQQQQHHTVCT